MVQPERLSEVLEQLPQTQTPVEVEDWDPGNYFELGMRGFHQQVGCLSEAEVRGQLENVLEAFDAKVHPKEDFDEPQQLLPSDYQQLEGRLSLSVVQPLQRQIPAEVEGRMPATQMAVEGLAKLQRREDWVLHPYG